ncbi:MAG: hypothetical protein IPM36_08235 [Lewinellaceae bacterium]|nr:hypothetical protein [Lewinellaceae bacterium]
MLQNWLKPLTATSRKNIDTLDESAFGKNIALHGLSFPNLNGVRIALIGAGDREANAVRAELYRTAYNFPAGAVADLGNLRRSEPSVLIPVFFELLSGNILPVLLAQKNDLARAQFLAYHERKSLVNLVAVDESLRLAHAVTGGADNQAVYSALLQPRHPLLFHFGLVGFQTHQTEPGVVDFLTKNNFDALRLGKTRSSIEETEPILRDADLLTFHLGALKQSEAPVSHSLPLPAILWKKPANSAGMPG